jgi:hypothetical protein
MDNIYIYIYKLDKIIQSTILLHSEPTDVFSRNLILTYSNCIGTLPAVTSPLGCSTRGTLIRLQASLSVMRVSLPPQEREA